MGLISRVSSRTYRQNMSSSSDSSFSYASSDADTDEIFNEIIPPKNRFQMAFQESKYNWNSTPDITESSSSQTSSSCSTSSEESDSEKHVYYEVPKTRPVLEEDLPLMSSREKSAAGMEDLDDFEPVSRPNKRTSIYEVIKEQQQIEKNLGRLSVLQSGKDLLDFNHSLKKIKTMTGNDRHYMEVLNSKQFLNEVSVLCNIKLAYESGSSKEKSQAIADLLDKNPNDPIKYA